MSNTRDTVLIGGSAGAFSALKDGFRPAIDPMFRSAAVHRSSRSIGIVLSGLLDDGAVGLEAIVRQGGLCIVQDPDSADFPDMPLAAHDAVPGSLIRAAEQYDLGTQNSRSGRSQHGN